MKSTPAWVSSAVKPSRALSRMSSRSPNASTVASARTEPLVRNMPPRRRGGMFLTSGSVRAEATVEALGLLLDILDKAREGFTAEETQAGVDFIGKTAPGRYATADTVAEEAASLSLEGLTTEFTTANLLALADVDAPALAGAYNRYVSGQWTVVIVGDASLYAEGVRALGRGEVTVVPA